MPRKISSDGATTSAKVFSCLPFPLVGLMLAASIYNKQIEVWVAVAGLALLGVYAWLVSRCLVPVRTSCLSFGLLAQFRGDRTRCGSDDRPSEDFRDVKKAGERALAYRTVLGRGRSARNSAR